MAEVEQKDNGKKGGGKQKKMNVRIDFTPMVDMNMLLITFFMLCTSLSKPQTMEISMPTKDKVSEEEQSKVQESRAITILLGKDDKVYYYTGQPNYEDYTSLKRSNYGPDGLRSLLMQRNQKVVNEIKELKKLSADHKISDEDFKKRSSEIRDDKSAPVVIIKATDDATYKNLIDALDEMQICSIGKYAIVDIAEGDNWLIENLETAGSLTAQSDLGGNANNK